MPVELSLAAATALGTLGDAVKSRMHLTSYSVPSKVLTPTRPNQAFPTDLAPSRKA